MSIMANIEGEDLGRVARQVKQAIQAAGEPPRGVAVDIRGQIEPMELMFSGLAIGLGLAILAIFLLLTAYFQSVRLALVVMAAAPAVVAGVVAALLVTNTTLNMQSFMGAIMAIGVATANSILLVTFAERPPRGTDSPRSCTGRSRQSLAAYPHDKLRHDRRHAADGPGAGRRRPTGCPAWPGCHWRVVGGDADDALGLARHLRRRPATQFDRLRLTGRQRPEKQTL